MGFCSRCGEPCALAVCSCGGLAKTPAGHKVLYTGRSVTPDTDRWERRYVQRSPATTPKQASRTLPDDDNAASNAWQSKRTKHLSLPTYAMSGHGYDDVETLRQIDDAASPNVQHQKRDRIPSSKEVQEVEETISRAFGSVLDPAHQRHKWSCHSCSTMFLRDQTVYPDPGARHDPSLENVLYCPKCFSAKFSLGNCVACGDSVLPDAATPFVQRKDKLWHAECYACLYCAADLSKNPQVDLYGNPCCATCFDNAAFLKDPTVARVPALLSADKSSSGQDPSDKKKDDQRRKIMMPMSTRMGPAVNELRTRLETGTPAKLASSPAFAQPTSSRSPQPSPNLVGNSAFAIPAGARTPVGKITPAPLGQSMERLLGVKSGSHVSIPSNPLAASPRPAIASPRIAASKAFFDGGAASGPLSPSLPPNSLSNWARPSPKPIQTPDWQRHRPSQSMPFIPKQSYTPSGPAWLQSPILASTSAFTKPGKEGKVNEQSTGGALGSATSSAEATTAVPAPRTARPLPAPPATEPKTLSRVKSFVKDKELPRDALPISQTHIQGAVERVTRAPPMHESPSPKKMSAGILSRSRSFRQAECPKMQPAKTTTAEGKSRQSHVVVHESVGKFKKSVSTGELAEGNVSSSRPVTQRAQTGLSRSNATFKAKSPKAEKDVSAANENIYFQEANKGYEATNASPLAEARCSGCNLRLFSMGGLGAAGQKVITIPGTNLSYHARCFTCDECKKTFEDGKFVELEHGRRAHEKCAPMQAAVSTARDPATSLSTMPVPSRPSGAEAQVLKPSRSASRLPQQYMSAAQVAPMSPSKTQAKPRPSYNGATKLSKASEIFASREKALSSPVFGGMYACAGCGEGGTLAETTLGPVGTRFHHKCLRCLCGKQLDSGAKSVEDLGLSGKMERRFACRTCIDNKNLARRSFSSVTGIAALRS